MHLSKFLSTSLLLIAADHVTGSLLPININSIECIAVNDIVTVLEQYSSATSFCSSFLSIQTQTFSTTTTTTLSTVTDSVTSTTLTSTVVLPVVTQTSSM
jgi:hypothetical protein